MRTSCYCLDRLRRDSDKPSSAIFAATRTTSTTQAPYLPVATKDEDAISDTPIQTSVKARIEFSARYVPLQNATSWMINAVTRTAIGTSTTAMNSIVTTASNPEIGGTGWVPAEDPHQHVTAGLAVKSERCSRP